MEEITLPSSDASTLLHSARLSPIVWRSVESSTMDDETNRHVVEPLGVADHALSQHTVCHEQTSVTAYRISSSVADTGSESCTEYLIAPKREARPTEVHRSMRWYAQLVAAVKILFVGSAASKYAKRRSPAMLDAWGLFVEYGCLDPNSDLMRMWDSVVMVLVFWTSVATPYDVAFLEVRLNFVFAINRAVELLFALDILRNFMLPVRDGGNTVSMYSRSRIAKYYLRGWFFVDFVSILPFDTLNVLLGDSSVDGRLSAVRMLKVLRLLKVARLARNGRISFGKKRGAEVVNYTFLQLVHFLVITLMVAHWIACGFKLVSVLEATCPLERKSYVPAFDPTDPDDVPPFDGAVGCGGWLGKRARMENRMHMIDPYDKLSNWDIFEQYLNALYWSVMTVSTIGYGDLTPTTQFETMYAIVAMLLGGFMFGYVIGAVGNIIATREAKKNQTYRQMEDLNEFIASNKLDNHLAEQLRRYFGYRGRSMSVSSYNSLLSHMSPELRGRVLMSTNQLWIRKVALFHGAPIEFIVQVALVLNKHVYPPQEAIIKPGQLADRLYIINRGVVAGNGKLLTIGQFAGEEALLRYDAGRASYLMKALTFVECSSLHREDLINIFKHFPEMNTKWRRYTLHMVFRSEVMAYCDAVRLLSRELEEARDTEGVQTKRRISIGMMLGTGMPQRTLHYMQKLREYIIVEPKEAERLREAATKVQAIYRGHRDRKLAIQMKWRAIFSMQRRSRTRIAMLETASSNAARAAPLSCSAVCLSSDSSKVRSTADSAEGDIEADVLYAQHATVLDAIASLRQEVKSLSKRLGTFAG